MTASSSSSRPTPVIAETSTNIVSPPYSSGTRPYSVSWPRTLVGSAPSRSILFTATTIGHVGGQGVVERLDGLRHHAVVGRHHQHGDVGRLRTTGTHGGERLVTRGVDEGDLALVAVDLGGHLVGTDGLGDATGLAGDHVGLADRVEQLRLAVVDVTHDGDDRRTGREVLLATLVLAELDVEALQQLAVLVLGRDDLDLVVELGRRAPASVSSATVWVAVTISPRLNSTWTRFDTSTLIFSDRSVSEAPRASRTVWPVTLADADATDLRRLHLVELLTTLPLGLAPTTDRTTGATEGTLGAAATTTAAAAARRRTTGTATGTATAGRPPPPGRPDGRDRRVHRDHGHRGRRPDRRAGRRPAGASSPGWGAACRARRDAARAGGDRDRPAGGRGPPGRAPGSPGASGAAGRGGRAVPMPCDGANGLLPGRGAPPGRRSRRGAGAGQAAGRAGPRARVPVSALAPVGRLVGPSRGRLVGPSRRAAAVWPGARGTEPGTRGRGRRTRWPVRAAGGAAWRDGGRCSRRRFRRRGWGEPVGAGAAATGAGAGAGGHRPGRGHGPVGAAGLRGAGAVDGAAGGCGGSGAAATGGLTGWLLGRRRVAGQLLLEASLDGRLHGGGGGSDELPHVLQHAEDGLAFDSELFRELVDTDLCHCSPCWRSGARWLAGPVSCRACSLRESHRVVMSVSPLSGSAPACGGASAGRADPARDGTDAIENSILAAR